jgi:hypothetical protein
VQNPAAAHWEPSSLMKLNSCARFMVEWPASNTCALRSFQINDPHQQDHSVEALAQRYGHPFLIGDPPDTHLVLINRLHLAEGYTPVNSELNVGLISIPIFGLRPSLHQTSLSVLIGGVTTRSEGSGPLSPCL